MSETITEGYTLDVAVFRTAPSVLAAVKPGSGGFLWFLPGKTSGHIQYAPQQPSAGWRLVARYLVAEDDKEVPAVDLDMPCFVISRLRIMRLLPHSPLLVHPGLFCPVMMRHMHAAIQAAAPEMASLTSSEQREQAGVVLWRQDKVVVQHYKGPSERFAVEPRCGDQRDAPLRPDETLLAEFHTHPVVTTVPVDVAPPLGG